MLVATIPASSSGSLMTMRTRKKSTRVRNWKKTTTSLLSHVRGKHKIGIISRQTKVKSLEKEEESGLKLLRDEEEYRSSDEDDNSWRKRDDGGRGGKTTRTTKRVKFANKQKFSEDEDRRRRRRERRIRRTTVRDYQKHPRSDEKERRRVR